MTWPTKTDFVDGDVLTATQVNNIGTNLNEADPTGITDGYVLTADGAGGMGWEAVAADSMTLLTSGTSASGVSFTLSSISSAYTQLEFWLYNINSTADCGIRIEADQLASYGTGTCVNNTILRESATSVSGTGGRGTTSLQLSFGLTNKVYNGNEDNFFRIVIPQYSSTATAKKMMYGSASYAVGATTGYAAEVGAAMYRQTSAVAIDWLAVSRLGSGTFTADYKLWGVK